MTPRVSQQALAALSEYRQAERDAYNDSDLRLADLFSEDFILTSNGVATLRGRGSVREFFRALWANNTARFIEVVDEDIDEAGNCLVVAGRFTLEVTPKAGGTSALDHGRFQGILKRCDNGRYMLWREACMDAGPPISSTPKSA